MNQSDVATPDVKGTERFRTGSCLAKAQSTPSFSVRPELAAAFMRGSGSPRIA